MKYFKILAYVVPKIWEVSNVWTEELADRTDGRTVERTDKPKTIGTLNFFEFGGIIKSLLC